MEYWVGGIVAPAELESGRRVGYEIVDLATGARAPWLCLAEGIADVGPFMIVEEGASLARRALQRCIEVTSGIVIVDEIGPLELDARGHSWAMGPLAQSEIDEIVLVVRPSLVPKLEQRWGFQPDVWEVARWEELGRAMGLGE